MTVIENKHGKWLQGSEGLRMEMPVKAGPAHSGPWAGTDPGARRQVHLVQDRDVLDSQLEIQPG